MSIFHIDQAIALIRYVEGDEVADRMQDSLKATEQDNGARPFLVTEEAAVINQVVDICGEMEEQKGFREDATNAIYLRNLGRRLNLGVDDIAALNRIADRIDVLNNVVKLMLTVSELAEAMTDLRKNDGNAYGEELADAVIRIFSNAQQNRIPLGDEIVRKIDKNSERPVKHGHNF